MTWATHETKEFYFLDEVAEIARMSLRSLRSIIRRGRLRVHQEKPGATIRVRHADLVAFIDGMRCEVLPDAPTPRKPRKTL